MSIVLIWWGWSGLSWIWLMLNELDLDVVVVDANHSLYIDMLERVWVKCIIGHWIYKVQQDDIIIFSQATANSPELQVAKKICISQPLSYSQFVAQLSRYFKTIAIAWTHWKSTTTSMAIDVFYNLVDDFAIWMIGAQMPKYNNQNYIANEKIKNQIYDLMIACISWEDHPLKWKYYFIYEADEFSKRLVLTQNFAWVITNIDYDHIEIFPTQQDYDNIFLEFVEKTPKVFVLKTEKSIKEFCARNNLKSEHLKLVNQEKFGFVNVAWEHNQKNASLIFHLAKNLENIEDEKIINILEKFVWIWRRMEKLWEKNSNIVYSDYAHHPVELETVYDFLSQKYSEKQKIIIFQPHQATRLLEFWEEFSKVLKKFDKVFMINLYPARENFDNIQKQVFTKMQIKINSYSDLDEIFRKENWFEKINYNDFQDLVFSWENSVFVFAWAGNIDDEIRKLF